MPQNVDLFSRWKLLLNPIISQIESDYVKTPSNQNRNVTIYPYGLPPWYVPPIMRNNLLASFPLKDTRLALGIGGVCDGLGPSPVGSPWNFFVHGGVYSKISFKGIYAVKCIKKTH